jgi:hypothetical protein
MAIAVTALTVVSVCGAWAEERENYLPNPGFEEGMEHWGPWLNPTNGTAAIDDEVSRSGGKSLRFDYKPGADPRLGTYIFAANQLAAILTPGQTYTMSGWIRIAGVPPGKSGPIAYLCCARRSASSERSRTAPRSTPRASSCTTRPTASASTRSPPSTTPPSSATI